MGDRLVGKVALVSGGARGQGEAEARRFVAEGARVLIADVSDQAGTDLAKELGEAAAFEHLDVSEPESWGPVVESAISRWGKLDILINNAGIGYADIFDELPLDHHRRLIDVNLNGVLRDAGRSQTHADPGRGLHCQYLLH
jgi:3alpha(or 20beta)-hydroxysteroid dehydrogenase